jgi:hypothetical protein
MGEGAAGIHPTLTRIVFPQGSPSQTMSALLPLSQLFTYAVEAEAGDSLLYFLPELYEKISGLPKEYG